MISIYVLTTILFGVAVAIIARAKGRSWLLWGCIGLLIGPFGLIVALIASVPRRRVLDRCPACAEPIRYEATVCRHCHSALEWTAEP